MRTVGWLIKELSKFPYDAECYAYEGEVVGISIRVDSMQKAFIHCSESDGDPDTYYFGPYKFPKRRKHDAKR